MSAADSLPESRPGPGRSLWFLIYFGIIAPLLAAHLFEFFSWMVSSSDEVDGVHAYSLSVPFSVLVFAMLAPGTLLTAIMIMVKARSHGPVGLRFVSLTAFGVGAVLGLAISLFDSVLFNPGNIAALTLFFGVLCCVVCSFFWLTRRWFGLRRFGM